MRRSRRRLEGFELNPRQSHRQKAWIESLFALRRTWFSAKRKTGARPLRGLDAPELRTMRDLQVEVVSA
ncbi:MAG: hypothetical protein JSR82_12610 [Verrucomicrobia bacterium]|nr:hypothetical protein [Verrucomicrobiota bacterium]